MLDNLSRSDRLAGGGAAVALVGSLLPWYHFDEGSSHVTTNAFGTGFLGDLVFLCAAAMLLVLLVRHDAVGVGRDLDDQRVDTVLGGTALGAVVLQLLIGVNGSGAFHHATIGLLVALAATTAMALSAWLRRQDGSPRHASPRRHWAEPR